MHVSSSVISLSCISSTLTVTFQQIPCILYLAHVSFSQ